MATVEQLAEELRVLAEQQGQLQQFFAQFTQASIAMLTEAAKPKSEKSWTDGVHFKNFKIFGGELREWEEFAVKFKGQVAAGSVQVAEVLDYVEAEMAGDELEEDDYAQMVGVEGLDDDKIVEIGHKMHNLLLNLTTGEANAVVRRFRGRNGLLA